jgi:hypothetical protein
VTGVQTCALPISCCICTTRLELARVDEVPHTAGCADDDLGLLLGEQLDVLQRQEAGQGWGVSH